MLRSEHIALYPPLTFLLCFVVIKLATRNAAVPRAMTPANPHTQMLSVFVIWIVATLLSAAAMLSESIWPVAGHETAGFLRQLLPPLIVVMAGVAAMIKGDDPGAIGLSFGNPRWFVVLALPAVAILFVPGGSVVYDNISAAILLASFADILVFRGYVQPRLQAVWGRWPGLVASSLMFAVSTQVASVAMGGSFDTIAVAGLVSFLVWGVLAGMIYERVGSVYGLVISYLLWNAAYDYIARVSL